MAADDAELRAFLDQKSGTGSSKEEQSYYNSMRRRLGYADQVSMVETVSAAAEPAPVTKTVTKTTTVDDSQAPRLIELEFGGAEEVQEFEPVLPKAHAPPKATEFVVEEAEEDHEEAPVDEDNEFILLLPDEGMVEFTEVAPPAPVEEPEEEIVEFEELDDDWDQLAAEPAPEPTPEPKPAPKPAAPAGDSHNGFSLYRRELDGGQHVYFYSKKSPSDAEPATIPEGYETRESDDTGLPYLARAA